MVNTNASVDRFESNFAVLILSNKNTDQLIVPLSIIPKDVAEGDIVSVSIRRNSSETEKVKRRVGEMLRSLENKQ
jgi:Protein of unknown function (DUF3006)